MNAPAVVGLDLSLSSTGIANELGTRHVAAPKKGTLVERCAALAELVLDDVDDVDLVVIEDLPSARLAGAGSAVKSLGILHGVVRLRLHDLDVPVALAQPASLKKYAAGKGNARKPDVRMGVYKRFGVDVANEDECDAFVLWAMGMAWLGSPVADLPAVNRSALDAVDWPAQPEAVGLAS